MSLVLTPEQPNDAEPTIQTNTLVEAFPEAVKVFVCVQCQHMPTDGFIALTVPGPNGVPLVAIPKTAIHLPNMSLRVLVEWPAGFDTSLIVDFWRGSMPPPPPAVVYPYLIWPMGTADVAATPTETLLVGNLLAGMRLYNAAE